MLKERILEQAGKLFYLYGIKNVSMDDLASTLGVSKRTIYENFKDKEDILNSFLMSVKEKRDKLFAKYVDESSDTIEIFLKIIEYHSKNEMPAVKFYEEIFKYYPNIHQKILADTKLNKLHFRNFLKQGVEQGYFRDDLNIDIVAFLVEQNNYTFMRAAFMREAYVEKPSFSHNELFFNMMINFIRGVSTHKGIEIIDEYLSRKNETK